MPKSVGVFSIRHEIAGKPAREIKRTPCKELSDKIAKMDAYWTPRLGDNYLRLKEDASCIDDEDVYLQSAEASLTYSKIRIEFVGCK